MDDLNEFPDSWVELFNAGDEPVFLPDYKLGLSSEYWEAWSLPNKKLAPGNHLLIYCDKQATSDKYHTNFRLESGKGCTLYLFKSGAIIDQLPDDMKKQPSPNISYGRKIDGVGEWGYQSEPTPNKTNCGKILTNKEILESPIFSVPGQILFDGSFILLELKLPEGTPKGTVIRYTLDGSEPNLYSPSYNGPFIITDTKIVRAKLFCDGYLSPVSTVHSYIKFPRKQSLPIISIVTDDDYLYSSSKGILSNANYRDGKKNYLHDWRRPINIELFEPFEDHSSVNQLCEARVAGGKTRDKLSKTICVYANKRFGEKRLKYEFFPDQRPLKTDFKSILLRNSGNDFDFLYMRDAIIQKTMSTHCDIDWQAWRPAIIYINGVYKGILNIRERSNDDNIYTNYDGLEDIDMIENAEECKAGTWDNWNQFVNFYSKSGHSLEEYSRIMDINSYIDVMIMNFFFCNLDFPGNNSVWWRPRAETGKWRYLVKDTDYGLGLEGRAPDYNVFEWFHHWGYDEFVSWSNTPQATLLFRNLEKDQAFTNEFVDRFAIYMGDFLNYDGIWKIWEPMYESIKNEYPYHATLYGLSVSSYNREFQRTQDWVKKRVGYMYSYLKNFYKTGALCSLDINKFESPVELSQSTIYINGIKLSCSKFDGRFFANKRVTLEGDNVVGWKIFVDYNSGEKKELIVSGDTFVFTMPNCKSFSISSLTGTTGIEDVSGIEVVEASRYDVFDLSGRQINKTKEGVSIIRNSDGTQKKIWK